MRLRSSIVTFICFLFIASVSGQSNGEISISKLKKDLYYLASDELQGRFPGTEGDKKAAEYIAASLKNSQLELFNKNGFQEFQMVTGVHLGTTNTFGWNGFTGKVSDNYTPFSYSGSANLNAPVVFAGYGFDINEDGIKWNDYSTVDVKGKWVLLLRGEPYIDSTKSVYRNYGNDRNKVLLAKDKGAAGVIFVSGVNFDKNDELVNLHNNEGSVEIPVLQVKRIIIDSLFGNPTLKIADLEKKLIKQKQPLSFDLKTAVNAYTEVSQTLVTTRNVVGFLPSQNPAYKDQYIIIGAHYDHLGFGGPGTGSRRPDTLAIHNGADDNASGVTAILSLADKFSVERKNLKRSVIFVLFSGEEEGILGSSYFTDHLPVDVKAIKTYINLDMVGRLKPDSTLEISGTGTSVGAEPLLKKLAIGKPLKLSFSPEGYGPSDHASFYSKNIPVFFLTTGVHLDYHTPSDKADKINYEGLKEVDNYTYDLAKTIINSDSTLTFREAGPKVSVGNRKYKITLGIMPDFASSDNKGLKVELVLKGKPAEKGGLKNGDIIVGINGKPVTNIQDYMFRLNQLKAKDIVGVTVLRKGEKIELVVNL